VVALAVVLLVALLEGVIVVEDVWLVMCERNANTNHGHTQKVP
jgi:hypothetical protein